MKKIKFPELKVKVRATKGEEFYIKNSDDVIKVLRNIFNADTLQWTEEFILVCLSKSHKVIGYYRVSIGGFSGTICDPKVIMTIALQTSASAIIIAHNHPSGNTTPSDSDDSMTKKINNACKLLDITLLDHIILTENNYYSFCDNGNL